jgi:hypothetical protein
LKGHKNLRKIGYLAPDTLSLPCLPAVGKFFKILIKKG